MTSTDLTSILEQLQIPEAFRPAESDEPRLEGYTEWNEKAQLYLSKLSILSHPKLDTPRIIASVSAFTGDDKWIYPTTRDIAGGMFCGLYWLMSLNSVGILESLVVDAQAVQTVIQQHIKPLFTANPHPFLSTSTGRTLHRGAGGPMATQDYYNEQSWKSRPGTDNVIAWCIGNLPVSLYAPPN